MFIPNDSTVVGSKIRLKHDVRVLKGTFTRGSNLTVVNMPYAHDPHQEYELVDEQGNSLRAGSESFETVG